MAEVKDLKEATYEVKVDCWNCGTSFKARIPKGTFVNLYFDTAKCPQCGCCGCVNRTCASPLAPGRIG